MSTNDYETIKFGVGNHTQSMTLTSTPDPVTSLDWLKNNDRAELVKFSDLSNATLEIRGELADSEYADFFAIPYNNFLTSATIQLKLFEDLVSTTDLLGMTAQTYGKPIPLGIWKTAIDPYDTADQRRPNDFFVYWFDSPIEYQAAELHITHNYTYDPSPPSNGILLQDGSGVLSVEAETGTITNVGSDIITLTADGTASDGNKLVKSGPSFFNDHTAGPYVSYEFTSSVSETCDVWIRCKSTASNNSFYIVFNGVMTKHILPLDSSWHWVNLRSVVLVEGELNTMSWRARDYGFHWDKIVVQTPDNSDPSGTGPAESGEGEEGSENNVSLSSLIIGKSFQPQYNYRYGGSIQFMTGPELQQLSSGLYVPTANQNLSRVLSLNLDQMSDSDKMNMADIEMNLNGQPLVVSALPNRASWFKDSHEFLAYFMNSLNYGHRYHDIHEADLVLVEG